MVDLVGFRVRNQNKILQIDGRYENQELVSVDTYVMSSRDNDIFGCYAAVNVPSGRKNPIIAVSGSAQGVYIKRISAGLFYIYSGSGDDKRTVRVYIFADPYPVSVGGSVGLVVRNRVTGTVVYNSNNKYIRVLGFESVSLGLYKSASATFPGKTIAIIQGVRPYARKTDDGGPPNQPVGLFGFFSGIIKSPDTSTYIIEHRGVANAVGGRAGNTLSVSPWGSYLVIDVTGY
ncbi:hypothetical protein [Pseudomonas piscis]|uniref:hypothetical protein n=1 Tax=Pseudomonas piscis TaxID=2614538 RepID=UPI0021D57288|nr:hypothetical protein [Pseudomonas piscis]MCU7649483.1 hypothetical protein [Pseudomonas piscis]